MAVMPISRRTLTVLVAYLWVFAGLGITVPDARAQKGVVNEKPDAGWSERDYLLHYASTICVWASYGTLDPKPANVLDALAQETWAMVEFTGQEPAVYDDIHKRAAAYGQQEAPARALAGCAAWTKRNAATVLENAKLPD